MTSTVEQPQAPAPSPTRDVTVRDWLQARPARAVHLSAALLVLLQLGLRGWAAPQGYFSLDDFLFMGRSVSSESVPHFLFTAYNGHFMPGSLLLVKAMTAIAPLQYWPVVVVSLVLQAVVSVLVYRLLVRLCGVRPAILVPFAVYLFSVITLPTFLWMAAWIQALPQQLAMVTALLLHVRYLQEGRRRDAFLAVLAVALGLLFFEKTVLTVGVLFLLTALYFTPGRGLASWWRALRNHGRVWVAHVALLAGYVALYFTRTSDSSLRAALADDRPRHRAVGCERCTHCPPSSAVRGGGSRWVLGRVGGARPGRSGGRVRAGRSGRSSSASSWAAVPGEASW